MVVNSVSSDKYIWVYAETPEIVPKETPETATRHSSIIRFISPFWKVEGRLL